MHCCRHGIGTGTRLAATCLSILLPWALVFSNGCSGKTAADAKGQLEKLKKKEKPKPPFDHLKVFIEPGDKDAQTIARRVKPGHWTGVLVETKANNFDFSGDLNSSAVDGQSNPVDLENCPFRLLTSRSAALPKGQKKTLETIFFAPRGRTTTFVLNQLRNRQHGSEEWREMEVLPHMPDYQFYMFVLARDPSRYRYLKVLDCIQPPGETFNLLGEDAFYYRVVMPRPSPPLMLPTRSLCWTTIAFIVWDDVLPSVLLPEQQQAMLEWLHWGGGLIISGPQTLDALRGSFLEPCLPATAAETTSFDEHSLADLNRNWTIREAGDRRGVTAVQPWSGIKLAKHPQAEFLPGTGELVAERRVGRGRVVVTAFRLSERELVQWRSFDSFFNACLLRRPPRIYKSDQNFEFMKATLQPAHRATDPAVVSNVRIFTRDAHLSPDSVHVCDPATEPAVDPAEDASSGVQEGALADGRKRNSGVAAWDDFNMVSSTARKALRDAAGISVPKREFVLWMIGIYLLLIVPVNWLVFRVLGRVEWAWLAVPVVAIGWGLAVIWLAQLDIGFARSETEIAVLEMHAGFSRGHLTRYTALYSSLSTSYSVHFDDPAALAQPFAADVGRLQGQSSGTVTLRNFGDSHLDDYLVSSNSTGLVHSEQMVSLGGNLIWQNTPGESPSVENHTALKLFGVTLLRRPAGGQGIDESCWIGDLAPGDKVVVRFTPHAENREKLVAARELSPLTRQARPEGALSLRLLLDVAEKHQGLEPGDVRLVGWRNQSMAGVRVEPAAAQVRKAMLVVAHLQLGAYPPKPDMNLPAEPRPTEDVFSLETADPFK
ncbi:MAG: hypothetical protein HY288_03970 [Planctomycetia bacterium]|nr:hypothetical protein [Planctomycetia bacterium]